MRASLISSQSALEAHYGIRTYTVVILDRLEGFNLTNHCTLIGSYTKFAYMQTKVKIVVYLRTGYMYIIVIHFIIILAYRD